VNGAGTQVPADSWCELNRHQSSSNVQSGQDGLRSLLGQGGKRSNSYEPDDEGVPDASDTVGRMSEVPTCCCIGQGRVGPLPT
jgi:hypothetical protein